MPGVWRPPRQSSALEALEEEVNTNPLESRSDWLGDTGCEATDLAPARRQPHPHQLAASNPDHCSCTLASPPRCLAALPWPAQNEARRASLSPPYPCPMSNVDAHAPCPMPHAQGTHTCIRMHTIYHLSLNPVSSCLAINLPRSYPTITCPHLSISICPHATPGSSNQVTCLLACTPKIITRLSHQPYIQSKPITCSRPSVIFPSHPPANPSHTPAIPPILRSPLHVHTHIMSVILKLPSLLYAAVRCRVKANTANRQPHPRGGVRVG